MRQLVYDVAASIDGFITGPNGDVSCFLDQGDHVKAYSKRLEGYDTVVMGRTTYEFGFAHGMAPGQRAYSHMRHYIVSSTLKLPDDAEVEVVGGDYLSAVRKLKAEDGSDIYLCGGGALAAELLSAGLIDRLVVKVNPVVLGTGTPIFAGSVTAKSTLKGVKRYRSGVVLLTYDIG